MGRRFTIVTDHKALQCLQTMQNAKPRLTRWALVVQPFDSPARTYAHAAMRMDCQGRHGWMKILLTHHPLLQSRRRRGKCWEVLSPTAWSHTFELMTTRPDARDCLHAPARTDSAILNGPITSLHHLTI